MLTELTIEMKAAVAAAPFPTEATGLEVWGFSLREILTRVLDNILELGRDHRDDIEQAAKAAVDAIVAFDLPGIPPIVENYIDEATRTLGYQAIDKVLDAILAETIIG